MTRREQVALSKAIAHALRHDPSAYGLALDDDGWVPLGDLVDALRRRSHWSGITVHDVAAIIEQSAKRRYEIDDDRIRALYGHSVRTPVHRPLAEPPRLLFHGTTRAALDRVQAEGLRPMARQYVHLSTDVETARAVARRRDPQPVVLQVAAAAAHAAGIGFRRGNDDVWLADHVPASFLSIASATGETDQDDIRSR